MQYTIYIGEKPVVLKHDDFGDSINVDSLTLIDHSNLFGELTTAAASANRVGLMKAELENLLADSKFELKIFESKFKAKKRIEASENGNMFFVEVDGQQVAVKISEKALDNCFETNDEWIALKKKDMELERRLGLISSLHWAAQQKSRSLANVISGVTPSEFMDELMEGSVNGFIIKKPKR